MFKIFSFVWSATNFREYMKCIYDYIYHKGFHFWADLNLAHTKMLLFYSTFFVFGSLLLSWFHNYGQNVADMSHIILCYITFHHIIYFFRVTIIYEEFSWAILDMAEILLGILILFIGVWFVLYTHYEEPDTSAANSTAPPLANIAEIMNESS
jgi:signal transduction histidine kinase